MVASILLLSCFLAFTGGAVVPLDQSSASVSVKNGGQEYSYHVQESHGVAALDPIHIVHHQNPVAKSAVLVDMPQKENQIKGQENQEKELLQEPKIAEIKKEEIQLRGLVQEVFPEMPQLHEFKPQIEDQVAQESDASKKIVFEDIKQKTQRAHVYPPEIIPQQQLIIIPHDQLKQEQLNTPEKQEEHTKFGVPLYKVHSGGWSNSMEMNAGTHPGLGHMG